MFPLFPENRKSLPYFFCGKNLFQKSNPPDFKFYLSNLNNKTISPYGVMLILSLFSLQ